MPINRAYKSFLITLMRAYQAEMNLITAEIKAYTNDELKDSFIFFLCAFQKITFKDIENFSIKDPEILKKYIIFPQNQALPHTNPKNILKLTILGKDLAKYIQKKIDKQSNILKFNGLSPQDLAKVASSLKRFENFWMWIYNSKTDLAYQPLEKV